MCIAFNRCCSYLVFIVTLALFTNQSVTAQITKIEITSRSAAFDGRTFGEVGGYEKIKGIATGEIDPADRRNALITDIQFASKNAHGRVEYRTNFTMLKPIEMKRSSGVLFYNIVNRGFHNGTNDFNVGGDPGDGFLYKRGETVLWSGWQGDIPLKSDGSDREGIDVPVAHNPDGSSITGPVWARWPSAHGTTVALPGAINRMPASLDPALAKLVSVRSETPEGVKVGVIPIASSDWAFADCRTIPFPGVPDSTHVCLKNGFNPELLYELVYTAKDPLVLGVGMAAMRDLVSFFRYSDKDSLGNLNPLFAQITRVVGQGTSQSGRFAKSFLNLGFNEDERGRIVWDGLNVRIAGMMGGFNIRFAQPGDIAEMYDPGADGPLWWGDYVDKARYRTKWGLLHRCRATNTCPKITETYGGPEFWYSRGSVGITGTTVKDDLPLPDNVRRYYESGTPHGGGRGGFSLYAPTAVVPDVAVAPGGLQAMNPNPERETDRALYVALVDWVVRGTLPPPSVYPHLSNGTLVPNNSTAMGWPRIPNVPAPDGVVNPVLDYNYGPLFRNNDDSGVITNVPPPVRRAIPTLVPKVDADGNELGGVASLLQRVPLGTYTGWNPILTGALKGRDRELAGGYVPFARTKEERLLSGDPRLAIAERYPDLQTYYAAAERSAKDLMRERFLLPEDAIRLLKQVQTEMEASGLLQH